MRDKQATRDRMLDAAARILAEGGPSALGINAVERAAGCGKPLIYRYFGGLDGLVAALADRDGAVAGDGADPLHRLLGAGRALATDRTARDLIRLALDGRADPAAPAIPEGPQREAEAILKAGVLFLLLWRDHHPDFAGVALETPKDLARLEAALAALVAGLDSGGAGNEGMGA